MDKALINIGNTHTHFASLKGEVIGRCESDNVLPPLRRHKIKEAWVACVVPTARKSIENELGSKAHFIAVEDLKDIDFSNVDSSTTGADRLANLCAVRNIYAGEDVLVLDCGTCVTGEFISKNTFMGGFIHPGRRIKR